MFVGIDPGRDGSIACLNREGAILVTFVMPMLGIERPILDLNRLDEIFSELSSRPIEACYLEFVASRPQQSAVGTFKFGRTFGATEALLTANRIPFQLVTPKVWTKEMHQGISGDDPKQKSKVAAARLYPGVDLRKNDRCKVAHDGIIDALLIAEYGRRQRV